MLLSLNHIDSSSSEPCESPLEVRRWFRIFSGDSKVIHHSYLLNHILKHSFSESPLLTVIMQGIPLLIVTFAVLYLGYKLLSFVKALQAIQYVNNSKICKQFLLNTIFSGTTPGNVFLYHCPQMPPYRKYGGLLLGRIIYSSKNINVSILDSPSYPCIA